MFTQEERAIHQWAVQSWDPDLDAVYNRMCGLEFAVTRLIVPARSNLEMCKLRLECVARSRTEGGRVQKSPRTMRTLSP